MNFLVTPKRNKQDKRAREQSVSPADQAMPKKGKADSYLDLNQPTDCNMADTNKVLAAIKELDTKLIAITKRLDSVQFDCINNTKKLKLQVERSSREKNLIIKGLPEKAGETGRSLAEEAISLFTSMGVKEVLIDNAFRIGTAPAGKPRIAKIKLLKGPDRDEILRKKAALGKQQVFIEADLSPEEQGIKKKLIGTFHDLKKTDSGIKMKLKGRRLIILKDSKTLASYSYDEGKDQVVQD
ncbi:hypothetical protein Fcan01_10750 [Folsomia candida]|uniref:Uncharacterized protein n=1 Tax=Folsomia candida TaxID=158441 RepID=A0A226EBS7_FOLCA|nr:hypothetical protein Fcan01_10750 [Folsomia candida]